MTDQPSREGDSERFVIWLCDECGWHILDENSAGEGQPCEAWLIGPDEIEEHGPTRRVELIRSTLQAAETERDEALSAALHEDLQERRAEAAEAQRDALLKAASELAERVAAHDCLSSNLPVRRRYLQDAADAVFSLLSTQEPTR